MKKVIVLQNSPVFTVDITNIYKPDAWELHLILNQKSYDCLCKRDQQDLLASIKITEDFSFDSLKNNIDFIIINTPRKHLVLATNTESLIAVTGQLRDYFTIPGMSERIAMLFSDKIHMKNHLSKLSVPLPKYCYFDKNEYVNSANEYLDKLCQQISFPIISKPIDSAGCHGVNKIHDRVELEKWASMMEHCNFELDEYIEGELYHCDSFVHQGNILYTVICRYSFPAHQFLLGKNLGSIILANNDPRYQKLKKFNDDILKNMSTDFNGVTHLEVFEKNDGQLVFLEVANRGGGAGIPKIYNKYLGIDLFSTHFLLQCDDNYQFDIHQGAYAAWLQFTPCSNVTSLEHLPSIKSEINLIFKNKKINSNSICTSLRDYSLLIMLWNDDVVQLQQDFNKLSIYRNQLPPMVF